MMASSAAVAAATFAAMYAAHQALDHWGQTDHQSSNKGRPGPVGRRACASHVAVYTLGTLVVVLAVAAALGYLGQLQPPFVAAATALNAASHYWADRRVTLARLARLTGHARFYTLGAPRAGRDDNPTLGTGAYALDQSWHVAWLLVCSVLTAAGTA